MEKFRCVDVVPGCSATFHGSEDDIRSQVAAHAARDHGIADVTPEMVGAVRSAMRAA